MDALGTRTAKLVLGGHSEGVIVVARYANNDVRAVVLSWNGCKSFDVVVPSLAVVSQADPLVGSGRCEQADERLVLEGSTHEVLRTPQARRCAVVRAPPRRFRLAPVYLSYAPLLRS